ncbi:MAG: glycosyltransferase family 2 protein [Paludibacteraceae bacterium]|nr:glycosyltransferase family 2 protein [Paludibacteraceae bacterium]
MKLSIITINYNNAEGLRKTLASVASQTYANIEHIIVDGASTDGSVDVIKEYENQLNITHSTIHLLWSSEPDNGIYDAMNRGIRKATGEYVQILNSGDLLAALDVTERMMAALDKTSNIQHSTLENGFSPAIFYGNMLKSYDGKTIISRDTCGGKMYTPESFLYFYKGTLNHDCAYIRRDLFEKYGLYNEDMKICSDWEWYVRAIVLGGEKPIYTNIDVTIFDMNGVSESHGKNAELIKKERREYLESILPPAVLHDYDRFAFPLLQYQRLKKHHLWGLVHFIERVLFKLEKWGMR